MYPATYTWSRGEGAEQKPGSPGGRAEALAVGKDHKRMMKTKAGKGGKDRERPRAEIMKPARSCECPSSSQPPLCLCLCPAHDTWLDPYVR